MPRRKEWYSIKNAASGQATVWLYGDIGESWHEDTVTARKLVKEVADIEANEIVVRISSYGGSVPDGIAIINAFNAHPAQIIYQIDAVAYSIASYIATGKGAVHMASNAMMMIHAPWSFAGGNADDLRETADQLDAWQDILAQGYADKAEKNIDEINAEFFVDGKDHYLTADEAVAYGLADHIIEPVKAAASSIKNMQRFLQPPNQPTNQSIKQSMKSSNTPGKKIMPKATAAKPAAKPDATPAATPAVTPTTAPVVEDRAAILAADKTRRAEITAKFEPFCTNETVSVLLKECLDDHEMLPQAAGEKLLAALSTKEQTPAQAPRQQFVDRTQQIKDAAVSAIMCRAGLGTEDMRKDVYQAGMKSFNLMDFARQSIQNSGLDLNRMSRKEIVGAAFTHSTSDFTVLLENVMHKTLVGGYTSAALTWQRFCATGSVSDFRPHNRYMRGSLGNLLGKTELNEFKHGDMGDGEKQTISATTKGMIISISREMVVNDDLGAFVGLAGDLGRSAARTVEADVYAALASNSGLGPLLSDGNTLFHADHNNIGGGAALSVTAIEADRVLMASQLDHSGNEFLDIRPAKLVVPIGLGGTAREINAQEYNDEATKNQRRPNVVRGLFDDVVDSPRITGTRRYLFADPAIAPVLEVAFLDGMSEPTLEQEMGFTVDGTSYKVVLDYGVAGIGYQGAVTDAGA